MSGILHQVICDGAADPVRKQYTVVSSRNAVMFLFMISPPGSSVEMEEMSVYFSIIACQCIVGSFIKDRGRP